MLSIIKEQHMCPTENTKVTPVYTNIRTRLTHLVSSHAEAPNPPNKNMSSPIIHIVSTPAHQHTHPVRKPLPHPHIKGSKSFTKTPRVASKSSAPPKTPFSFAAYLPPFHVRSWLQLPLSPSRRCCGAPTTLLMIRRGPRPRSQVRVVPLFPRVVAPAICDLHDMF